jgi:hypothetical protein
MTGPAGKVAVLPAVPRVGDVRRGLHRAIRPDRLREREPGEGGEHQCGEEAFHSVAPCGMRAAISKLSSCCRWRRALSHARSSRSARRASAERRHHAGERLVLRLLRAAMSAFALAISTSACAL